MANPSSGPVEVHAWRGVVMNRQVNYAWGVNEYARQKSMDPYMLRRDFKLEDGNWHGAPCVRIPWLNSDGTVFRWRIRLAPDDDGNKQKRWGEIGEGYEGEPGLVTGSYSNALIPLYGAHLVDWEKAKAIILVEGESDVQALHELGIEAVGIPGASTLSETQAMFLKTLTKAQIYVHNERDSGARLMLEKARELLPDAKVFSVADDVKGVKDPCDLMSLGHEQALGILERAISQAIPIAECDVAADTNQIAIVQSDNLVTKPALVLRKGTNHPENSYPNLREVLEKDSRLYGRFRFDSFSGRIMVCDDEGILRPYSIDNDGPRLYMYLGEQYGFINLKSELVNNALSVIAQEHSYNRVTDWYENLPVWDGKDRISTLFHDLLGAEDNELNSALSHLFMRAIVARTHRPGTKYDYCIVFKSQQGIGKQKFGHMITPLDLYFSITSIGNKDDYMLLQTGVVGEFEELAAMSAKRASREAVKSFITRDNDKCRAPYGRGVEDHPRHCVFYGSTNESAFLSDITGERRFPVVECGMHAPTRAQQWIPGDESWELEKAQIHAQALREWMDSMTAPLVLPPELEEQMRLTQGKFTTPDDRTGRIEDYLEEQAALNHGEFCTCIPMICEEALHMEPREYSGKRSVSNEIVNILTNQLGCEPCGTRSFKSYGKQKGFFYRAHKQG